MYLQLIHELKEGLDIAAEVRASFARNVTAALRGSRATARTRRELLQLLQTYDATVATALKVPATPVARTRSHTCTATHVPTMTHAHTHTHVRITACVHLELLKTYNATVGSALKIPPTYRDPRLRTLTYARPQVSVHIKYSIYRNPIK